jgi:hypothetical protein
VEDELAIRALVARMIYRGAMDRGTVVPLPSRFQAPA